MLWPMQSLGESSTHPRTPCSASGECGGSRSSFAAWVDGGFLRGVRMRSGGALAAWATESLMAPANDIVRVRAKQTYSILMTGSSQAEWDCLQSSELTQDKCYRGGELDEASGNTLTQVRGYRNNEHESVRQTRVPRPHPRPLPARRSAAQAAHPRRVLRHLRLSSQKRPAPPQPAAGGRHRPQAAWPQARLRPRRALAGAQVHLAIQRPALQQTAQGRPAGMARTLRAPPSAPRSEEHTSEL